MDNEKSSITALISSFSRAYHAKNSNIKVFDDNKAIEFISEQEYKSIGENMIKGISFFNPTFKGDESEALDWVVRNQLAPSPLGRAAYAEEMLENAVKIGARQYLILGAGMDTFAYRQPTFAGCLNIFELDHPDTQKFKEKRLNELEWILPDNLTFIPVDFTETQWIQELKKTEKFNKTTISFCTLLGLSYYLSANDFVKLLSSLSRIIPEGSSIVFDYPDENTYEDVASERVKKQVAMASFSGEKMLASYSYIEIEQLLSDCGFLIYEHLTPDEISERYFYKYNVNNFGKEMYAFENVNYCLAVKKR